MPLVIVDDCPLNLGILKRLASEKGARQVLAFPDPNKALAHLGSQAVALIIVDHSMEGMDGLELVAQVRAGGPNAETPIVMVTGSEDPCVRDLALASGVQGFLVKPIDVAQFKAVVSNLLGHGGWPHLDRRESEGGAPASGERRLAETA